MRIPLGASLGMGLFAASPINESTEDDDLSEEDRATVNMFEKCRHSVVHINTTKEARDFLGLNPQEIPQGSGSGFAWDDQHVVTNYHVIMNADKASVTLSDHSTFNAKLVGVEPDSDLAVLRIERPAPLAPLALGRSSNLRVGQRVFAIGNPFGLDNTLTGGIVSGTGREMKGVSGRTIRGLIQTDAAINPGNSGGPLLNHKGELIGVNTMIASPSGAFAGVGFAIPVAAVARVVRQLVKYGHTKRPWLGVYCLPDQMTKMLQKRLGSGAVGPGVLIVGVDQGSPAAGLGLRPTFRTPRGDIAIGDEIIAVQGRRVTSSEELVETIEDHKIGETISLSVRFQDRMRTVEITLGERPDRRQQHQDRGAYVHVGPR